jgi:hypothetical protein
MACLDFKEFCHRRAPNWNQLLFGSRLDVSSFDFQRAYKEVG